LEKELEGIRDGDLGNVARLSAYLADVSPLLEIEVGEVATPFTDIYATLVRFF
jgi:hypothetical protein